MVENLPAMQEMGLDSWVGKIPWRRECLPTLVFLYGESHGQKNLEGSSPWDFPGKNTGVGCHSLLQGIFLTQGSNPVSHVSAWQADSLPLRHWGKAQWVHCIPSISWGSQVINIPHLKKYMEILYLAYSSSIFRCPFVPKSS